MKVIKGYGAPDPLTRANVNDLYVDLNTSDTYRCTNIKTIGEEWGGVTLYAGKLDNTVHDWKLIDHVENIHNQDIIVTNNGTYTADEGYTGLGNITVDVTKDASAYGAWHYVYLEGTTKASLSEYDQSVSKYIQIYLIYIQEGEDEEKYYYFLDNAGIAGVISTERDNTYTMSAKGVKENMDTGSTSSVTVTLTITVSNGAVTVKNGSSLYDAEIKWRHVTASALY